MKLSMSEMKNNKAEGYDEMEMMKCLGDGATDFVVSLCHVKMAAKT